MLPQNDIKISPNRLYNFIADTIDKQINVYNYNQEYIKLLTCVKNEILDELNNFRKWQLYILSYNICEHSYTVRSKMSGKLCGRNIQIKPNENIYKCGKHSGVKHTPKERKIDDDMLCSGNNKKKQRCKNYKKYDGFCVNHYKSYFNLKNVKDVKSHYLNKINTKNKIEENTSKYDCIIYNDHLKKLNILEDSYFVKKQKVVKLITYYNENKNIFNICYYCNKDAEPNEDCCLNCIKEQETTDEEIVNMNIKKYVDNMITSYMDTDFLYDKYFLKNVEKENVNHVEVNTKNMKKLEISNNFDKKDLKKYLNNGFKIYNDIEYKKDMAVYDIKNGKKINVGKLLNIYKDYDKMKTYIENNKRLLYLNKYNKIKSHYYNEKDIKNTLECIQLSLDNLIYTFHTCGPDNWQLYLNEYKDNITEYIIDLYNIDDKYKLYI